MKGDVAYVVRKPLILASHRGVFTLNLIKVLIYV